MKWLEPVLHPGLIPKGSRNGGIVSTMCGEELKTPSHSLSNQDFHLKKNLPSKLKQGGWAVLFKQVFTFFSFSPNHGPGYTTGGSCSTAVMSEAITDL